MSEYTPTTEEVRNGFSRSRQMPQFQSPTLQADFDRWLAAHDAEVRASVVAEEPEWEYGVEVRRETYTKVFTPSDAETQALFRGERRVRRRKAGPWVPVPVEQGRES